jgi:UDP-glucuronate decarboxylase
LNVFESQALLASKFPSRALDILVTGGAGFLGSHLCEHLVFQGHNVVVLDNFHTGRRENLLNLLSTNRLTVIQHDVLDRIPDELPKFDEIYNLACPASPPRYQEDPIKTSMVNAQGSWNVLQRAQQDNSRIFHASTSEVYGDPMIHPQTESYWGNVNIVGPRSCYDEGKRFAETLFHDHATHRGVSVRMARIFNTYGPRMQQDDGRVISNFIVQALTNEPITVYGDGTQTRSFCFVSDLIKGFDLLMHSNVADSTPVNLGNPNEVSILEVAKSIVSMTGSRSKLIVLPLPTDDPRRRRPDITKAETMLGWGPTVTLSEGLEKSVNYFERELAQQNTHNNSIKTVLMG